MADSGRKILLTGFEPFGGHRINPSWEAIRSFAGYRFGKATVTAVLLPVEYERGARELEEAIADLRPAAVISFGLGGEAGIRLETTAHNGHRGKPDNAGLVPGNAELVPAGIEAAPSRLPLAKIAAALKDDGIPVEYSGDAGGYVCNAVFYAGLRAAPPNAPAGFVHLPRIGSAFPLPLIEAAVKAAIAATATLVSSAAG